MAFNCKNQSNQNKCEQEFGCKWNSDDNSCSISLFLPLAVLGGIGFLIYIGTKKTTNTITLYYPHKFIQLVRILDSNGQVVFEKQNYLGADMPGKTGKTPVSGLKDGIYSIEATCNGVLYFQQNVNVSGGVSSTVTLTFCT